MSRAFARRLLTAALASCLLVTMSATAGADLIVNDEDLTVDAAVEQINMVVGDTAQVALSVSVADCDPATGNCNGESYVDPDGVVFTDEHKGCNIEGNTNGDPNLVLDISQADAAVASVTGPDASTTTVGFVTCGSTPTLDIEALTAGSRLVTFSLSALSHPSTATPTRDFNTATASFQINVAGAVCDTTTGGPGCIEVCEDPAAPAWAAHILQTNDVKKKKGKPLPDENYVAQVAHEMGTTTDFHGIAKTDHPAYEQEVLAYLQTVTGATNTLTLPPNPPFPECHYEQQPSA